MNIVEKELAKGRGISVVSLIQCLFEYAHEIRASDIHLDPTEHDVAVRLRVDGELGSSFSLAKALHAEVISRIKVIAGLRADVHSTPQDGRARIVVSTARQIDIRVSVVPTYFGENAVIRLLSYEGETHTLLDLGMNEVSVKALSRALRQPHGMVLVTGPTGSGKTTTLYTLLEMLNQKERSLVTIEDPIEYSLKGVSQIQVNPAVGLTFSQGLRAVLRQDPNVLMVGEIRDEETARIAVNAALTGHLVLSTLHTNDAPSTLPRLVDMKVDPYLIASTIQAVVAQRLVRKICNNCRQTKVLDEGYKDRLAEGLSSRWVQDLEVVSYGEGCEQCGGSGFRGRIGLYEIMPVGYELKSAISRMASLRELRSIALAQGLTSMREDGLAKVAEGVTTIEEVVRIMYE